LCWSLSVFFALISFCHCKCEAKSLTVTETNRTTDNEKSMSTAKVFTDQDMEAYNVRTLVELLNLIPGVSASETSVNIQGGSSKSVAVIMDGRPLFNPASGKVYLGGIPIQSIKEVRVIQGAEAAVYGGNTAGGVIVITSKQGKKKYANKIDLAYGMLTTQPSYSPGEEIDRYDFLKKGEINLGTEWNRIGFFINALYEDSEGDRKNRDDQKSVVKGNMDFPLFSTLKGTISGMYSNREKGNPGKEYRLTPESRSDTTEWGSSVILTNSSFKSRTYGNRFHDEVINPPYNIDNELDSLVFGQELNWHGNLKGIPDITLGANAEHRKIDSNQYGKKEESIGSLVISKGFDITAIPLNISIGIKSNLYSDFPVQYNPQFNIDYRRDPFYISFLADRGTTLPTFEQRYYSSASRLANPDLSLEKIYNLKLKFSQRVASNLDYSIVPFYTRIRDRIEYYRFSGYPYDHPLYGKAQYQNLDSATSKGFDINVTYKPIKGLTLDLYYTYLEAKNDKTGNYLFQKPLHKAMFNVRYQIANLVLQLKNIYDGSRYDDSMNRWKIEDRYKLDLKVDYTWEHLNFYFEMPNAFDRRYEVYRGYPGARRSALFGVYYNF